MITPDDSPRDAHILIVDDNRMNVDLLGAILEEAGFRDVAAETSGERAVERWREESFDLLLLDIRMPGIDGHEVMRQLNSDLAEGDWLPVIILTAQIDPQTREQALTAGALDFITKPFNATEVVQRIDNLLRVRALHNAAHGRAEDLSRSLADRARTLQRTEQDLEHLAHHDPATGLPNRHSLLRFIDEAIETGSALDLVMVHVRGHEAVERLEGYAAADLMLREIGQRLRLALEDQTPGRVQCGIWGGSTLLLAVASRESIATSTLQDCMDASLAHLRLGRYEIAPSASAGHVRAPDHGRNAEELIRRLSLTLAKGERRGSEWLSFDPVLEQDARRRHQLEYGLTVAREQDQLHLLYQPKIELASGCLVGFEALMRWEHPRLGLISPGEFIPLAENTGRIAELGEWALHEALAAARRWREASGHCPPIAVNVSTQQFAALTRSGRSLVDAVQSALKASGLNGNALEIEITETAVMHDVAATVEELRALRALGVSIAIDDFGTGYSSLAYLRRLPATTIKIDRSLIDGVSANPSMDTLARAILSVSRGFGLTTVAEGIETEADARHLAALGCPIGQGYLYHRPLPETDASGLLARVCA